MPATTSQSGDLLKKFGKSFDAALDKAADTPVKSRFTKLPGGITNGIAQLSEIGLAEYGSDTPAKTATGQSAAGKVYFFARGIVYQPKVVMTKDGPEYTHLATTGIMISLFDTKNSKDKVVTEEEHTREMLDEMKKLGGPEYCSGVSRDNLEELMQGLLTIGPDGAGPFFKFTTSFGKPKIGLDGKPTGEPLPVYENWHGTKGVPPDFVPDMEGVAEDGTEVPEDAEEEVAKTPTKPKGKTATNGAAVAAPKAPLKPVKSEKAAFSEFGDLDSLAKKAAAKDKDSRMQLQDFAKKAGYSEQEITDAETWDDLASMIRAKASPSDNGSKVKKSKEDDGGGEEIELFTPEKGKPCMYLPRDKAGKPTGEEITVQPTKVSDKLETADLLSLDDGETKYTQVSWEELGPISD